MMSMRVLSRRTLQALAVSLAVQVPTGACAAIATDGGLLFSIWGVGFGLYWLLVLALLATWRGTPPALALSVVRWAFVPILVLAAPLTHGVFMNHTLRKGAASFASGHGQSECVPEALLRLADCSSFGCRASITTFVQLCLEGASHEKDLCAEVIAEGIDAKSWVVERCSGVPRRRSGCERIHRELAETCARRPDRRPPTGDELLVGGTPLF
jgi:hypothetical protein